MAGFLIAIISGILMSVQGVFNTRVTQQAGVWTTNCFVQLTALVTGICVWLLTERAPVGPLFRTEPKYMLLGGVIGAGITFTVVKAMDKMGPGSAVMYIVAAQTVSAYLIELAGLFGTEKQPVSIKKIIGLSLMVAGVCIFGRK